MPIARQLLLLVAAGLFIAGCSPNIRITRYQPSRYNLGGLRSAAVIHVDGPPESTGVVQTTLATQLDQGRFFQLNRHAPQGIPLVFAPGGDRVVNIEDVRHLMPGEVYIRALVTRWKYEERRVVEEVKKAVPVNATPQVWFEPVAEVAMHLQVINAETGRILVNQDYAQSATGAKYEATSGSRPGPQPLLAQASQNAVAAFLGDITPRTVVDSVDLDDDEPELKAGIEFCERGQLDRAIRSFEDVLKRKSRSPGAHYNLGVLYDAKGDYERATEYYRKAIKLNNRSMYHDGLSGMQKRMRDDRALQRR